MASIKVRVQVLNGPAFDVQLPTDGKLEDLRYRILRETLVPPNNQRLILNNAKVLPANGDLAELGVTDSANIKMIVTGGFAAEFPQPPKPSDSEIGRLFQLGWALLRTPEGREKLERMVKTPPLVEGEVASEPLAAGMMDNPAFHAMAISRGFLKAVHYAATGQELRDQQPAAPAVQRPPSPPRKPHAELLNEILEMGFDREAAEAALLAHGDDLEQALQALLG